MWGRLQKSVCFLRLCDGLPGFSKQFTNKSSFIRTINVNNILLSQKPVHDVSKIRNYCTDSSKEADEPNIEAITEGDPELVNKLKILILETDVMRQEGRLVPESLKEWQWKELLKLQTRSARSKYLTFLFKTEKAKENDKIKKEEKKRAYLEYKATSAEPQEEEDDGHIKYGLTGNNILLRIYDSTINQLYNNVLVQAMQFGQKLVIDCSYDDHMTHREAKNCAKQLMLTFAENRGHEDPYDLHLCNVNKKSDTITGLHRHIATLYDSAFPLHVHEESYLDLFPREQLVYLTPHCREELHEFDHDAVYIIGAMVDKINNEPLSLAKAKANNLKMAKLPLDKYLQWGAGSGKSLTLNQMVAIMLDVKRTGDWTTALRHVPRRKLENNYSASAAMRTPERYTTSVSRMRNDAGVTDGRNYRTGKRSEERSLPVSAGFVSRPFRSGGSGRIVSELFAEDDGSRDAAEASPPSTNLKYKGGSGPGKGFSFANRKVRSRSGGEER